MTDDRFTRGQALLAEIDPGAWDGLQGALEDIAPGLARTIVEFGFGDVYSREGLDVRTRELATVCVLAGVGSAQPQLQGHLLYALKLGWTREQLAEAMVQAAPFAGIPAAINGLVALRGALAALEG